MDNKETIQKNLNETINKLTELEKLEESIQSNWNDEIAIAFEKKYKEIKMEIEKLIKEIEELQRLL